MTLMPTQNTSYHNWSENKPVDVGEVILDIGCRLSQDLRACGKAPPATRCTVTKVFSWGVRVTNGEDEWDCEYWIMPEDEEDE